MLKKLKASAILIGIILILLVIIKYPKEEKNS